MADSIEAQLQKEQEKLVGLESARDTARRMLAQWEDYDQRREDGSSAQDRRHEETGQSRRENVSEAIDAVSAQQRVIADLKAKLGQA